MISTAQKHQMLVGFQQQREEDFLKYLKEKEERKAKATRPATAQPRNAYTKLNQRLGN